MRFSTVTACLSLVAALVGAAPLPTRNTIARRQIKLQDYADFQISGGVTGNAVKEANAVFVDPLAGKDLATIDEATLDAMKTMRSAAEEAETELFNPAIEAASGDEAVALENGKRKNKVLKLTGLKQILLIQLAQAKATGKDTASIEAKLEDEEAKLQTNIAADTKNAGQVSQAVV